MTLRVRIAPSPTGLLHVGNARAALFNWLFARRHGGTFIVRIDDTDIARSEPRFEEDILESLRWLGMGWDEGIEVGGPHGTYRQSDRFDRYREAALSLVEGGAAYHDDRAPEQLEELRARAQRESRHPGHYIRRPPEPASSGVIRLSVPQDSAIEFEDVVRGAMRFEAASVDDFVILRSDGTPTYHLASTVDDIDYSISHVIRGEDLLSSTPKHVLLASALGASPPVYAHLPLLYGPDGSKLSKRHGHTAVRAYRELGYLPEAMVNFLTLLGWSLEGDRTIFPAEEAIARFDLSRVSKNPAVFDVDKLTWMNGEYIRALDPPEFSRRTRPFVEDALGRQLSASEWERFESIAPLVQERTKVLGDVGDQVRFVFDEAGFDPDSWDKVMTKDEVPSVLRGAVGRLSAIDRFGVDEIEASLRGLLDEMELSARKGLQPIRVAVTGSSVSPPLFESIAALGRERTLERLEAALARL